MASVQHPIYFMRDCSRFPSRRLTPAGKFWIVYLGGVTVGLATIIWIGYRDAIAAALDAL